VRIYRKLAKFLLNIQGDFESCADILTYDRTPQNVTIELINLYTDVYIFREEGPQSFSKNVYEKMCKKIIEDFLLSFDSKLSHLNLNLNLNLDHKWLSPTWKKPIWFWF
jgi:hypothetical protein